MFFIKILGYFIRSNHHFFVINSKVSDYKQKIFNLVKIIYKLIYLNIIINKILSK